MTDKWNKRFQIKSDRWVFVPTDEAKATGAHIKKCVEKHWSPPDYYFHLKAGGHVSALRMHMDSQYFFRADIDNFFGRIGRSRITRWLNLWFPYLEARQMASESVVKAPGDDKFSLPYGFVQSPILASLVLDKSKIGSFLSRLSRQEPLRLSVYVDDILISSNDIILLNEAAEKLCHEAKKSGFSINSKKTEGPARSVTAFNVELSYKSLRITPKRLNELRMEHQSSTSGYVKAGIENYIRSVNEDQLAGFI